MQFLEKLIEIVEANWDKIIFDVIFGYNYITEIFITFLPEQVSSQNRYFLFRRGRYLVDVIG